MNTETMCASATAILHWNAIPVFADVDPATCNVTAESIKKVLTSRTKAVIVVHYAGVGCEMDAIGGLTRRHGVGGGVVDAVALLPAIATAWALDIPPDLIVAGIETFDMELPQAQLSARMA